MKCGLRAMGVLRFAHTTNAEAISQMWTCSNCCVGPRTGELMAKNPTPNKSPLYYLLNEINAAAKGGLPLLAVSMAVALPDICASLMSVDGRTNSRRYKEWCTNNLDWSKFSFVTPDDLYSMRCGVLHNGKISDLKNNISRIIFTLPNVNGGLISNNKLNDACIYDTVVFCQNFTQSVFNWFEAEGGNDTIQTNLTNMMQYRENGVDPYIVGLKVIA